MAGSMSPDELQSALSKGLLAFPLTDFDAEGAFDARSHAARLEWLADRGAAAFFAAGGAGEFFSLDAAEYQAVVRTAVDTCDNATPVIASVGYGTRIAIDYARQAESLGADGILLLPPYLTEASQEGLRAHVTAVCRATGLGVVVYNRANCRLKPDTLAWIAEDAPNLIGFKDGVGALEILHEVRSRLDRRLVLINGMPTAELYARSFRAIGIPSYSSAIFNFAPRTATAVYQAIAAGDGEASDGFFREFLLPYVRLRDRQPGYAVSIVKAGAAIVGRGAGKVRPPLSELTPSEYEELAGLIARLGPQD